jgi:hypothetical protein
MRSGDRGRLAKRTPVAWATAFEIAGATGFDRALALDLGAEGPVPSARSSPSGLAAPSPLANAVSTRSRHWSSP